MSKSSKTSVDIIKRFSKGSRLLFLVGVAASIANTALSSLTPQLIKITVDSVIGDAPFGLPAKLIELIEAMGGQEFFRQNLYLLAGMIFFIALFSSICTFLSRASIALGTESFIKRMRDSLFLHIQKLPYSWHVAHQTGDIIQRVTSDMDVVRGFVSNQLIDAFRTTLLIAVTLSIMFSMNIKLSLVAIAFIPVIVGYSGVFYGAISKKFRLTDEAEGELASAVQENLTGVRVVRAFGRESFEADKFDEKNNNFSRIWIKLGYVMGAYWGFGDLFTGLQTMAVIVFGTIEAVNGQITIGELIAFLSYNSMLIWPIRGLGRVLSEMSKSGVSFERIGYILHAEEEKDTPGAIEPPMTGDIVYDKVGFSYDDGSKVLNNISFTIKGGSTIGILGGTGSGKSTMIHLLNRLHDPSEGKITIGGVDINNIKLDYLRKNIGMVLQEPYLFSRTIEENIGISTHLKDAHSIRKASSIACVDDAITSFKDGYDTVVGERGVTLSGGQKQRVAIARMLMQKAPIMVFDDSLSAVDSETDSKIRKALKESQGDATVILISHRINTLMQADVIMVLSDGEISQFGTHSELCRQEGTYKEIYDIQLNNEDRILAMGGEE